MIILPPFLNSVFFEAVSFVTFPLLSLHKLTSSITRKSPPFPSKLKRGKTSYITAPSSESRAWVKVLAKCCPNNHCFTFDKCVMDACPICFCIIWFQYQSGTACVRWHIIQILSLYLSYCVVPERNCRSHVSLYTIALCVYTRKKLYVLGVILLYKLFLSFYIHIQQLLGTRKKL